MNLAVIHGPNLNLLGKREPEIYGKDTIDDINFLINDYCKENNIEVIIEQFNSEGDIVSFIGKEQYDFLIINPAAYTHTSLAIKDAILAVNKPSIEVHLSNIYKREQIRHESLIAPAVLGQISGFGKYSYVLAINYLILTNQ